MITQPPSSWWQDYLNDPLIRKRTSSREDPRIFHDERLWKHDRIIVPKSRVMELIAMYHDLPSAGHWGVTCTASLLRRRYHIEHLLRLVRSYCRTCVACQQAKSLHNRPLGLVELF